MSSLLEILVDTEGDYINYDPKLWRRCDNGSLELKVPDGEPPKILAFNNVLLEKFEIVSIGGKMYCRFRDPRVRNFLFYNIEYPVLVGIEKCQCNVRGYISGPKAANGDMIFVCINFEYVLPPTPIMPPCPLEVYDYEINHVMRVAYPFTWQFKLGVNGLEKFRTILNTFGIKSLAWSRTLAFGHYFETVVPVQYHYYLSGNDSNSGDPYLESNSINESGKKFKDEPKCISYTYPPLSLDEIFYLNSTLKDEKKRLTNEDYAIAIVYHVTCKLLEDTKSLVATKESIMMNCYDRSWGYGLGKKCDRVKDTKTGKFIEDVYEEGLKSLLSMNLLYQRGEYVTLWELEIQMEGIVNSLAEIFQRFDPAKLSLSYIYHKINEYQIDVSNFCDEQMEGLIRILTRPVVCFDGLAGSGKTSVVKETFKHVVENPEFKNLYVFTAFQANTVDILSDTFPNNAFTMDSLLCRHTKCGKGINRHKEDVCPFRGIKYVIIDEVSTLYPCLLFRFLVDLATCGDTLEGIIFLGDKNQIQPIQKGDVINPLINVLKEFDCLCRFEHSHRMKSQVIINNAKNVVLGLADSIITKNRQFEVERINSRDVIVPAIINYIKKHNLDEYEFEVITGTWKISNEISEYVEKYFNEKENKPFGKNWSTVTQGRKIVFKKNNPKFRVKNNGILIVKDIVDIRYKNVEQLKGKEDLFMYHCMQSYGITLPNTIEEDESNLENMKLIEIAQTGKVINTDAAKLTHTNGYSVRRWLICSKLRNPNVISHVLPWSYWIIMNVRKAGCCVINSFQGSGIKMILYVIPTNSKWETREDVETAMTRATDLFVYFGLVNDLKSAINRPSMKRLTGIEERAKQTLKPIVNELNNRCKFLPLKIASNREIKKIALQIKADLSFNAEDLMELNSSNDNVDVPELEEIEEKEEEETVVQVKKESSQIVRPSPPKKVQQKVQLKINTKPNSKPAKVNTTPLTPPKVILKQTKKEKVTTTTYRTIVKKPKEEIVIVD